GVLCVAMISLSGCGTTGGRMAGWNPFNRAPSTVADAEQNPVPGPTRAGSMLASTSGGFANNDGGNTAGPQQSAEDRAAMFAQARGNIVGVQNGGYQSPSSSGMPTTNGSAAPAPGQPAIRQASSKGPATGPDSLFAPWR
ncbi:MAG: hypothetical protein AAFN70_05950, partial [Planctomycetota bacterium]